MTVVWLSYEVLPIIRTGTGLLPVGGCVELVITTSNQSCTLLAVNSLKSSKEVEEIPLIRYEYHYIFMQRFSEEIFNTADTDRGISDAVVVLLLFGVAVIAVALIAIFVFGLIPGDAAPTASLEFSQTSENPDTVTIYHAGGDDLPEGTLLRPGGSIEISGVQGISADTNGDAVLEESFEAGQEIEVTLTDGDAGDRLSVVYDGSVIGNFDLNYDYDHGQ